MCSKPIFYNSKREDGELDFTSTFIYPFDLNPTPKQHTIFDSPQLKIAVGQQIVVDPQKDGTAFTENFVFSKLSYQQLAKEVKSGKPIGFNFTLTPKERMHLNRRGVTYYRSKEYFKSSEFIVLDFDDDVKNNLTLDELKKGKTERARFLNHCAGLIFTSPHHRQDGRGDRLHVLFQLPEPIKNREKLKNIHKALQHKFKACDQGQNLTGAYTGCRKNQKAETIVYGNKITKKELREILLDYDKTLEGKEESKQFKEIEVTNPGRYAEATYQNNLEKLSGTHKGRRAVVLNEVTYSTGRVQHYLNKSDSDIIGEIMAVGKGIGLEKKYGRKELLRRIKKSLEDGQRDKYNYKIASPTKEIDEVIVIDSDNQTKLFANERKPKFMQFPKPILDFLPIAQKEAKEKLKDSPNTQGFDNFIINEINERKGLLSEPESAKKVLETLNEPNAINTYLALYCYAGNKSKLYIKKGKIVLKNVEFNAIIKILYPENNFGRHQRYNKRKKVKEHISNLNKIALINKQNSKKNVKFYPLIDELNMKGKIFSCSLPWEWRQIGAYIPKTLFMLDGKKKKEKNLLIQLYRRANQVYVAKKENGYKPPSFKSKKVSFRFNDILEISGLNKTFAANSTVAKKRLKEAFSELVKLNLIKKPTLPSSLSERITIHFQ